MTVEKFRVSLGTDKGGEIEWDSVRGSWEYVSPNSGVRHEFTDEELTDLFGAVREVANFRDAAGHPMAEARS